jgi:hypothetical protein
MGTVARSGKGADQFATGQKDGDLWLGKADPDRPLI